MNLRIAGTLVVVTLAVTACGGIAHTEPPNGISTPGVSTFSPTPTPTPTPTVEPMKRTATFNLVGNGGYTETVTLDVGSVQHFKPNLQNGTLVAGSVCTIDPQKDAVLPTLLTVTDTTPGALHQVPSVTLNIDSDTGSGPAASQNPGYYQLDVEENYSDGSKCAASQSGGSGWRTSISVKGTQNNAATTLHAFLVVHDYYTPAQPEGNPKYFNPPVWSTDQSILDSSAPGIPSHVAVTVVWASDWRETAPADSNQAIRTGGQPSSSPTVTASPSGICNPAHQYCK
jgi:hypothetical protein